MANRDSHKALGATDSGLRLSDYPLGSAQSRAAVRALLAARQESEAEEGWDKPLDCTGLAESLNAARQRRESGQHPRQWTPVYIPPGKENTKRGNSQHA